MTSASHSSSLLLLLCLASAGCYVGATLSMKLLGHIPFALLLLPVGIAFGVGAWFEVAALRGGRLGQVFILIFGFEIVMTALVGLFLLRESYGLREFAGMAAIIGGAALMTVGGSWQPAGVAAAAVAPLEGIERGPR